MVAAWWFWPSVVLSGLVLLLADLARRGWVTGVDLGVRALTLPRPAWLMDLAHVVDHMGLGAITITALLVVATLVSRSQRSVRPLGLVLVSLLALYAVVWPLKVLVGRGQAISDVVTLSSGGQQWPSGHAANVAFTAVVLTHLARLWTGRPLSRRTPIGTVTAPSAVMAATSLYLHFYWASDLVAGMLIGLLVAEVAVHLDVRHRRRLGLPTTGPPAMHLSAHGSWGSARSPRVREARGSRLARAGRSDPSGHLGALAAVGEPDHGAEEQPQGDRQDGPDHEHDEHDEHGERHLSVLDPLGCAGAEPER